MKPFDINTPNYIGIDFETTGLPNGVNFRQIKGKINVLNPFEKDHPFKDIATTQFGVWDSSTGITSHFHIDFSNPFYHSRFVKGSEHKRVIKDPMTGQNVTVDAYRIRPQTEQDIMSLVSKSNVKGKKAEALARPLINKALGTTETMYVYKGKHMTKFALDSLSKTQNIEEQLKNEYPTMDFRALSQREWAGKGKGSLYEHVDQWLKQASETDPLVIGGWNPFYDMNKMLKELVDMGHGDMAKKLFNQYQMGAIQLDAIENYWKAIVFRLAKEDSQFGKHFKIGTNAEATFATGRPGRQFRTFEEFDHSVLWNADFVGGLLKKHFGASASQTHAAGPDIHNEIKNIKKVLFDIAQESGIDFSLMTEVDAAGNLKHALGLKSLTAKLEEKYGKDFVKNLKGDIAAAQDFVNIKRKMPTIFEAISGAKKASLKLSRFGGIGAALAMAMAVTYGKGEDSIFPFSSSTKFRTMKKPGPISYSSQFEDKPNYSAQILQTLGFGVVGPLAALYAVGVYSTHKSPEKLGFIPKKPENAKEILKHASDNIYKGILGIEKKYPISRVFGLSNAIDYARGTFQHDGDRALSFYNIKDSKVREMVGRRNAHGVQLDELLTEAQKVLPKDRYDLLEEQLKPTDVPRGVSSRQVLVKNVKGKTIIAVSDKGEDGVSIASKYTQELPLGLKINKLRSQGQLNRLEWSRLQTDLIRSGKTPRTSFDDYFKALERPEFLKRTPEWGGVYKMIQRGRYHLDILPKGIGEGSNSIYPKQPQELAGIKYGIHVTSYKDDAWKTAKAQYNYMVKIPRNVFIDKMNQFMESPLELLIPTNTVDKVAARLSESPNMVKALAGKTLGILARPHLGLPAYDMRHGFFEYMGKFALKRILPAYAAYETFNIADHMLGKLTMSPTGRGPLTTAPIKAFESLSLLYSKVSDITGFTKLTKAQERVAPGSTGLGVFAPAASAASAYWVAQKFYEKGPSVIRDTINEMGRRLSKTQIVKDAMRQEAFKGALNRSPLEKLLAYTIKNPKKGIFALAMMPMIPFLPGLIGSNKSYAERKAEFKGDKEVAIRKYRGWLASPSPFAGGKPIQFRRHFLNLIESDYENRGVVWPSFGSHMLHNLSGGLLNRYALEEYHKEDQPVYESAPYGANIPFVGPLIAASIGRVIKPTKTYHKLAEASMNIGIMPSYAAEPPSHMVLGSGYSTNEEKVAGGVGLTSEGSTRALYHRWSRQFHDLIGFTGFSYETIRNAVTGKTSSDEFVPYAQSASEMYNPAQQMWGWHLGDITGVGGEFLRRIFPYPTKNWKVNNIANELNGVSWIPQQDKNADDVHPFKKLNVDLTHGTTFDKVPLGWLYGSRKGWEYLHPGVKGKDLEQYPDPIRLEILKSIAPYSSEFRQTSEKVLQQAMEGRMSPKREQQFYETLNQVRQLKEQLYANESEFDYSLDTQQVSGKISELGEDGSFRLEGNKRKYRLAGVSLADADIRARLLQNKKFNSPEELETAMMEIKNNTMNIMSSRMQVGSNISFETPEADNISGSKDGVEAIVGNLNKMLNDAGAPFKNTGNLAEHNMQQDKVGFVSRAMSKYWDTVTDRETFWNRKLIANRDYMHNYLQTQVFNREVKLWYKPIEHFIKPLVATTLHRGFLGLHLDKIPSFTVNRRRKQEYWDILRYVKYKSLAVRAAKSGNEEEAQYYHNLWRSTMIGANAMTSNQRELIAALPQNERPYFAKFSTEADPKKRGEIYKYLPRATKRIYSALWSKQIAEASDDPEQKQLLANLYETEGWGITPDEEEQYKSETGGNASKADWIRAKYVEAYLKKNPMPKSDWAGWSPDVNEENVELLALRDQGEQIEDYGFFENRARVAAYDENAYAAAMQINSTHFVNRSMIRDTMSTIIQNDNVSAINSMPTQSLHPVINIEVDNHQKHREHQSQFLRYADIMLDGFRFL